jgi:AraC-like DNA-binding protein
MSDLLPTGTDPVTELLDQVRATGAVLDQHSLADGRELQFTNGAPLALVVPLGGRVLITFHDGDSTEVDPEGVAILAGGAPYTVTSRPYQGARAAVSPQPITLMTVRYPVTGSTPTHLVAALPRLAAIASDPGSCPVSPAGFAQIASTEPGQQAFRDRVLDLLLIAALRTWFTRPGAPVPTWYAAHRDPMAAAALRMLDADLARRWTIAELAADVGMSRAALARHFTGVVGEPPMSYLRQRRLDLAGKLLRDSGLTLAAIANRTGFSSPFALSAAFKRERGTSPSQYRSDHSPARH